MAVTVDGNIELTEAVTGNIELNPLTHGVAPSITIELTLAVTGNIEN